MTGQVIKHGAYILSYDETHEQAGWLAYELPDALENKLEATASNDDWSFPGEGPAG